MALGALNPNSREGSKIMNKKRIWIVGLLLSMEWIAHTEAYVGYGNVGTNAYLVKGTVTEVKGPDSSGIAALTIRVDDVYSGPQKLMGLTFNARAANKLVSMHYDTQPIPIPSTGAEGIWAVQIGSETLVPTLVFNGVKRRWPSLPSFDKRYEQTKQLAQVIKSLAVLTLKEEKMKSLSENAFSKVPEISQWATWALSQDRFNMLLAIAVAKKEQFEGDIVMSRLETIAQRKSDRVPPDVLVAVVSRIVGNKEDPLEVRAAVLVHCKITSFA